MLGKEYIYAGRLEIKCPNCNTMNVINFKTTKAEVDKLFSWKDKPKEVKN